MDGWPDLRHSGAVIQEYPKWVEVEGEGDRDYPGHVLVNSDAEEREVTGKPKIGRPAKDK